MLQTSLCALLNIELPIIQAPIGGAATPALAAAVSNAGGLGMLPLTWHSPEGVRRVIRQTRQLTDRPFGVNLILQWPQEERLKVCLEEGVPVVSFFWGDPSLYVAAAHTAGSLVMHTVGSAVEARRVRDAGVDIIVAQGWEAGGHVWGQVATLPLVPCVVDAVAPTPQGGSRRDRRWTWSRGSSGLRRSRSVDWHPVCSQSRSRCTSVVQAKGASSGRDRYHLLSCV